ncbi:MAG: hypothetical protein WBE38_05695 [Terracidiphilus sp.]|jgi:hypothetical protein
MHFDFHFTAIQTLWTLTFAGLLVLLVVLLGRDRVSRFSWFTASMVLMALRMLASRLLFGRMASITSSEIFLTLADVGAIVSFMVVVEMARRAFGRASRTAWIAGTLVLLAVGVTVLVLWGPWPPAQTVFARSTLADLRLMQLVAQKGDLLIDLLIVELGLLVVFCGRRFNAGWRSHTQRIVLGLSTGSIAQLLVRVGMQALANAPPPQTQEQYLRLTGLQEKLYNANSVVFLVVVVWWIVCLWIDEPGAKPAGALPEDAPIAAGTPQPGTAPS